REMEKLGDKFNEIIFGAVEKAYKSGTISEDVYALAAENKAHYATFAVGHYYDHRLDPTVKQQTGTFSNVANAYHATIMKAMAITRHAAINQAKKDIVEFLRKADQHVSEEKPSKGRYGEPSISDPERFGHIRILVEGKPRYVEVDKYVAQTMSKDIRSSDAAFLKMANTIAYKAFHPILVSHNPAFGLRQVVRDTHQLYVRMPGYSPLRMLKYAKKAAKEATQWVRGDPGPLLREMLRFSAVDDTFMTNIARDPSIRAA